MKLIEREKLVKIYTIVFSVACAIAPMYWLPKIDRPTLSMIKYPIFLLTLILVFLITNFNDVKTILKKYYSHTYFKIFLGTIILIYISSLPGALQGNFKLSKYFYVSITAALVILLNGFLFGLKDIRYITKLFKISGSIVIFLTSLHVLNTFEYIEIKSLNRMVYTMVRTGFGTIPTNWSDGVSLFSVLLPMGLLLEKRSKILIFLSLVLSFNTINFSQVLAGGRGGLVTALLVIALFFICNFKMRIVIPAFFLYIANFLILVNASLPVSKNNVLRGLPAVWLSPVIPNLRPVYPNPVYAPILCYTGLTCIPENPCIPGITCVPGIPKTLSAIKVPCLGKRKCMKESFNLSTPSKTITHTFTSTPYALVEKIHYNGDADISDLDNSGYSQTQYVAKNKALDIVRLKKFNPVPLYGNRLELLKVGIKRFKERPFLGHGFGQKAKIKTSVTTSLEIHNVFLKYGVASGVTLMVLLVLFCFLPLFATISIFFKKTLKGKNLIENKLLLKNIALIISAAVVIGMLQPRYIYGGTNVAFIWWSLYGIFVSRVVSILIENNKEKTSSNS